MTESLHPPRERLPSSLFSPGRADELLRGPHRDLHQRPEKLVGALRIQPGDRVADIGAGVGYLTPLLSRAVGPTGRVVSEEIQREFLPELERFRSFGNVEVILGSPDDPRLPGPPMDCLVLLTVYHEVRNPIRFLRTLRRYSHSETRLAIVDFDPDIPSSTPAPIGHSVPERAVRSEAAAAGWRLDRREQASAGQYFLIFRPSTRLERALPQRPTNAHAVRTQRADR